MSTYILYYIITTIIHQTHSFDLSPEFEYVNISTYDDSDPLLDISEYTLHFKSYHLIWNNPESWTWNTSHSNNTNTTIACSKLYPSLCINTEFTTDNSKQLTQLKSMTVSNADTNIPSNNVVLDFWDDLDWSQVNIIHHNDPNTPTDRRQLLRGALTNQYYYDDSYESENEYDGDYGYYNSYDQQQKYSAAAAGIDESQIDTMEEMNDYIFNQDDDMEDVYNMDDYYKWYDQMDAEQWGVFKKIWRGIKRGARHIGGKFGIYPKPPCSGSSRCRVHLYFKNGFRKRANKKGHFCEGRWDRWRLHKYRVFRRRVSSIKVQGSPCCVAIAYNGNKFDGDLQAMFPRGRYRSMRRGLSTSMGSGNGMNGMGGGGMMGMMGGGMGMMGANQNGFRDKALASMKIVHDCKLRQRLMRRAMGRGGMWGGMHGGMQGIMQMMMMMKMMFPKHGNKHHTMCKYYSCIVKTQQSQLQQLMQMMMMSAMANQAPITISDSTKKKPGQRRRMMDNMHVIGVKKCKMLYFTEICVTFDSITNTIIMDYTVKNKKSVKVKNSDSAGMSDMCDPLTKVESLVSIFEDVLQKNTIPFEPDDSYENYEYFEDESAEEFADIDEWVDPDPFDVFIDYIDIEPEMSTFANKYYDDITYDKAVDSEQVLDEYMRESEYDRDTEETTHRVRKFLGPMMYGMLRNELSFADEFGYDLEYTFEELNVPTDNDMIDYFDTFLLEWNNENDWERVAVNGTKCNDILLSYISYAICMKEGMVYFEKNEDINGNIYSDKGLEMFYEKTNFMIAQELDNTRLDVRNEKEWTEVYEIFESDGERKRVCNYISMIKLCVEGKSDAGGILLTDSVISIEYLSDEESKTVIRDNKAIFNEWLAWSDLY